MAYNETPTDWTAMFLKNREFRIKMVKTPQNDEFAPEMEERPHVDPEQIAKIAQDLVTRVAITIGVVIAAGVAMTTVSEIILKKTKSADKE